MRDYRGAIFRMTKNYALRIWIDFASTDVLAFETFTDTFQELKTTLAAMSSWEKLCQQYWLYLTYLFIFFVQWCDSIIHAKSIFDVLSRAIYILQLVCNISYTLRSLQDSIKVAWLCDTRIYVCFEHDFDSVDMYIWNHLYLFFFYCHSVCCICLMMSLSWLKPMI